MKTSKKVLVLGASTNPDRYSYQAIKMLEKYHHDVHAIGNKETKLDHISISNEPHTINALDTISIYLSAKNQKPYYDYVINQKPKRVIFNPGTENPEFYQILEENSINFEEACTLVLLSTGQF